MCSMPEVSSPQGRAADGRYGRCALRPPQTATEVLAIVANLRGAEDALSHGRPDILGFLSRSRRHSSSATQAGASKMDGAVSTPFGMQRNGREGRGGLLEHGLWQSLWRPLACGDGGRMVRSAACRAGHPDDCVERHRRAGNAGCGGLRFWHHRGCLSGGHPWGSPSWKARTSAPPDGGGMERRMSCL